VAGCCECGDEPSDSCATELVQSGLSLKLSSRPHLNISVTIREANLSPDVHPELGA
jgi:hypothetical protein